MAESKLRSFEAPFVVFGSSGVAIRTRLKGLTSEDDTVLRAVGAHLGTLASGDLKRRCADGLDHSTDTWAQRKRDLTKESSSRWGRVDHQSDARPVGAVAARPVHPHPNP
jgi:hypothetical protein